MELVSEDRLIHYLGFNYYYRIIHSAMRPKGRPPILLLSGAFQDKNSWKKYITAFCQDCRIILVDLPGAGDSDLLPYTYDLAFLTEALRKIVIELQVDKIDLICVSYGTPIGYSFAKKYPEKISHLILMGTMKKIPDEVWDATRYAVLKVQENKMHEFAVHVINTLTYREDPGKINNSKLVERILYGALVKMNEDHKKKFIENTTRLLVQPPLDISGTMNTKSLIVTGEYDVYTKPGYCREIAQSIRNSVFLTVKNADHLFHLEQYPVTVEVIQSFIRDASMESIEGINKVEYY